MLRAKAVRARTTGFTLRERALTATDAVGRLAGIPVVAELVNAVNRSASGRALLEKTLGSTARRPLPQYHARSARKRLAYLAARRAPPAAPGASAVQATAATSGRVALFTTCLWQPQRAGARRDLVAVFAHNGIEITLLAQERCCGMPRLELGDLEAVARLKEFNIPQLARAVDAGYDWWRDSLVRAHVQAGAAADVPEMRRFARSPRACSIRFRISHAASRGGAAAHRLQGDARQGELPRALSPAGAEHRAEDA